MKKKSLHTSIIREIFDSKTRFLSIMGIIFLGVCFYAGIKSAGPDMIQTANRYYDQQKLMNQKVVSSMGITQDDLAILTKNKNKLSYQAQYSKDVNLTKKNQVVRFFSYNTAKKQTINQYQVVKGRLPRKSGEIALDSNYAKQDKKLEIGDTYTLTSKEAGSEVKKKKYTIVGWVNTPVYIETTSRGTTTVGKGKIDYFAVIPEADFQMDVYSEVVIRFNDLKKSDTYSKEYTKKQAADEKFLKKILKDRPAKRLAEVQTAAYQTIAENEQKLTTGEAALQQGKNELTTATEQTAQLKATLAQGLITEPSQLAQLQNQLQQAQTQLASAEASYQKEVQKLTAAKEKLQTEKTNVAKMAAPVYYYYDREDNPGFSEFKENAKRLSEIATVFPVFFFLIAALVCLTTMTRMVDEKRSEIGTLKALGYRNWEIAEKYLVYALFSSIIGSVLGLIVGYELFPVIIFNAYSGLYILPDVQISYYLSYAVESIVVAILCTTLSALAVLRVDLFSSPSILMRPKAPKAGKRILLERVPMIWRRLNFNQKVTARNLFRYKQRMFMTVLGIAGCMAMIITGFGLKDSIGNLVKTQFDDLWHYQATVTYKEDATKTETNEYQITLAKSSNYQESLPILLKNYSYKKAGSPTQEVVVSVPEKTTDFSKFVSLQNRVTQKEYKLTDSGAIITEKLANLFDVKVGDTIPLTASDNQIYKVKVAHITENYLMHYVYMSPAYYQKIMKEKPKATGELLLFKHEPTNKDQLANQLIATKKAANVSFLSDQSNAMDDTMGSLNIVVWVLIISAALLAFIVLYNLTNINISERIRELSTIKVLGFYNKEVTMYVYRENNILTFLGILVGCLIGKLLHAFVLKTAEVDLMMFSPTIHWQSYVYSGILTLLFSTVVMGIMHRKLRKVNMIEALKSNE